MTGLRGIGVGCLATALAALALFLQISPAQARWICVDPVGDLQAEDRICERTVQSIDLLLASGDLTAGVKVLLKAGQYGDLLITNRHNHRAITISAYPKHHPVFTSITIENSSNWVLSELTIEPVAGSNDTSPLFTVSEDSHAIEMKDSVIRSSRSVDAWTKEDWTGRARTGVDVSGRDIRIVRTLIENVRHGIDSRADDARFIGNIIDGFSGDGIRGLGDASIYAENTIKNCYEVDDNHDDGFQSWSVGADGQPGAGAVKQGVVSGNFIIGYEDPNQRHKCTLQGIGMFDGFFEDWVIEDNIVIVDHWHGITVMGARNVRISNNVVVDQGDGSIGPPWIAITNHKDGRPSTSSEISRNLIQKQGNLLRDGFGHYFGPYQTGVNNTGNILVTDRSDEYVKDRIRDWPQKHYSRVLEWTRN